MASPEFVDGNGLKKHRRKVSAIAAIKSPLADELKDREIAKIADKDKIPFVPFLDGSDANLALFRKLGELSTTQCAVISTICDYAFDGGFEVKKQPIRGLTTSFDNTITGQDEQRMIDFVSLFTTFEDMLATVKRLGVNLKTYGNAYLELSLIDVAGEKRAIMVSHDADTVRYMATEDPTIKVGIISPSFDKQYLTDIPPRYVSFYPEFDVAERGVQRTLIHIKRESVGRPYYGLPDSIGSLQYQFLEYQQGKYTVEGYANEWIAKVFMEVEIPSEEDESIDDDFDMAINDMFTNGGDNKKSALVRFKPHGLERTEVYEFKNNTNEAFHQTMGEIAENKIVQSHKWHSMLMSKTSGSMGNSQEFENVFRQKYTAVIMPFQDIFTGVLSTCFKHISEHYNTDLAGLSLGFANILKDYLELSNQQNQPQNDVSDDFVSGGTS